MGLFLLRRVSRSDWRIKEVLVGSAVSVIKYEHLRYVMFVNRKGKLIEKGGLPLGLWTTPKLAPAKIS
jgi:hypothetical protein